MIDIAMLLITVFSLGIEPYEDSDNDPDYAQSSEPDSEMESPRGKDHVKFRKRWSKDDVSFMKQFFSNHLKEGYYPTSKQLREFRNQSKIQRTDAQIRSKLQYLRKTK